MRKIKLWDSVRPSDYDFLEKISPENIKQGDLLTYGECVYYEVCDGGNRARLMVTIGLGESNIFRVPPEHVWKPEPEVGDEVPTINIAKVLHLGKCCVGWRVRLVDGASRGHEQIVESININHRTVTFTSGRTEDWNFRVELLDKSEPSPQIGDILTIGECKTGWMFEYIEASWIGGKDSEHFGQSRTIEGWDEDGDAKIGGGRIGYSNKQVKLISKGDEDEEVWADKFKRTMGELGKNAGEKIAEDMKRIVDDPKKDSLDHFREAMGGRTPDEKILDHCCESGPKLNLQAFYIPRSLLKEVISGVEGLPPDAKVVSFGLRVLYSSLEFREGNPPLNIILNGHGGWKVEGT